MSIGGSHEGVTMRFEAITAMVLAGLLLTGCGRPNASGIYVAEFSQQVTLVQLVETKDGILSGRLEEQSIDEGGLVRSQSFNLDGVSSGHDLMFKPTNAWFGSLTATGTFNGSELSLVGAGYTLNAKRSSLDKYQSAISQLQKTAAVQRQRLADAKAQEAVQAASAQAEKDRTDKASKLQAAESQIHTDAAKLEAAIVQAPDFGAQAVANTARISRMVELAPRLNVVARNQLVVQANQVVVATNQIEVARQQYAIGLNQIVGNSGRLADEVQRFCTSSEGAQLAQACSGALTAAGELKKAMSHAVTSFVPHKEAVQRELSRQTDLMAQFGG